MTGVEKHFIYWPWSRNLGMAIHFQQNDQLGKPPVRIRTEYGEIFRIQSECGKIWTGKNSVFGHFSYSDKNNQI